MACKLSLDIHNFLMNRSKVPVVMYHAILATDTDLEINIVHITLEAFEKQMAWLHTNGYLTISIDEMLKNVEASASKKSIVLTFDDGYLSLLKLATPILQKYGFKATLFLTSEISEGNLMEKREIYYPNNDRALTWAEVKELHNLGWDIQAHGANHLKHNSLNRPELYQEMNNCKSAIKNQLKKSPVYYSFPFGRYNSLCLKMLGELNFSAGFSVHQGLVSKRSDVRRLPRVAINRLDTIKTFQNKILTGHINTKTKLKAGLIYQLYKNTYLKDFFKSIKDRLISN